MRRPALALLALAASACVPVQPAGGNGGSSDSGAGTGAAKTPAESADTLRGIVTIVGSDPGTWLVLRTSSGRTVNLAGADVLRSVSGADVWVSGRTLNQHFEVARFVVRAVNDLPVHDGVVRELATGVVIALTEGGRVDIPDAPSQLAALAGSRVWVSTPIAGTAVSFGLIAAP